jgi:hypothetical protein
MKLKAILLSAAMAVTTATAAHAGAAWEFDAAGNSFNNNTWDFATAFQVVNDVTASGLGYYADPSNGQVHSNPVALYECDNDGCNGGGATLLASVTVDNTYALNGHFRYVTINPITLLAGHSYEVAGVSFQDNYTWNDVNFHTDANIIVPFNDTRWLQTNTPDFLNGPNLNEIESDGFYGPNVFLGSSNGFTGAPEPAAWGLMIAGFGLMGVTLRRRRAVAASA